MSETPKRGGLVLPRNPALELQRLMVEEGRPGAPGAAAVDAPLPSTERGAPAPPAAQGPEEEPSDCITGNTVSRSADTPTDRPSGRTTDGTPDQAEDGPGARTGATRARRAVPDRAAVDKVRRMGKSRPRAATVKLPEEIDDFITRYSRDNWEKKILKQDIIRRGLMLAILEIETGVELADLD